MRALIAVPEELFWPALIAALLVFIVALWCAISLTLALVGWRDLARDYATRVTPHGRPFYALVGSVGLATYRGLNAWTAAEGLFLAAPRLFRLAHKPLLIPWSAIGNVKVSKVLWADVAFFDVSGTPLKLPARVLADRPTAA